ncbi:MAG: enoyl-CoA hydratase/isomerase family protein [Pseudomonadota bacterium]|nr:enoyl-CoA hydratase/isomerase family protein [Pseudomonadota bacterium]
MSAAYMALDTTCYRSAMLQSTDDLLEQGGQPALILNLEDLSTLPDAELKRFDNWCRLQPCPVIGFGADTELAADCADVVVEQESELTRLLKNIEQFPQAATVLVQVLRTLENLSPMEGLVVESLGYASLQSGSEFKGWLAKQGAQPAQAVDAGAGPPILVTRRGDQLDLVLNRPGNDNAYTVEMRDALFEALNVVLMDQDVRRAQISANGRCFSSGGALSEFGTVSNPALAHQIRSRVFPARLILSCPYKFHFHVHKACIGSGIELPACGGHVTASPKTLFWLPELSMGLIPGAGGCVSISKRIGRRKTAYMVLLNKKIDAQTALRWGLIDAIAE